MCVCVCEREREREYIHTIHTWIYKSMWAVLYVMCCMWYHPRAQCDTLQHSCHTLQHITTTATHWTKLQRILWFHPCTKCGTLQHTAQHSKMSSARAVSHTATYCDVLHNAASRCSTQQRILTFHPRAQCDTLAYNEWAVAQIRMSHVTYQTRMSHVTYTRSVFPSSSKHSSRSRRGSDCKYLDLQIYPISG